MTNKNNILPNKNIQAGLQERIPSTNVAVTRELENIEKNIDLATVGSTAPFIGLLEQCGEL